VPRADSPATTALPVEYAQGGYEASFGTDAIDEPVYSFTCQVEGAPVRTVIETPAAGVRVFRPTAHREVDSPG
jgi:hypothetical protein